MRKRLEEIAQIREKRNLNLCESTTPVQPEYEHINAGFNKIKLGPSVLEDAVLDLGTYKKINKRLADKEYVVDAIQRGDLNKMREISNFYYAVNGIYARILRYMAFMYRYDWFLTPYIQDEKMKQDKVIEAVMKVLRALDSVGVKKRCGEIAFQVLLNGVYYGYKIENADFISLQELPPKYCRSRWTIGDHPVVEFNMAFFDDQFRETTLRQKMLKLFPKEFEIGYKLYKQRKLPPQFPGDGEGWYILDHEKTVKFNANNRDFPMFIAMIPDLIDLDEGKDLDKKRTIQRLMKLLIQQMPIDKNGDLVFDPDEATDLHANAKRMLQDIFGLDVLTTYADVSVESMLDTNASTAQTDDLARWERQVYNSSGISQQLFNSDNSVALEKSIINDGAALYNLILQFQTFLNQIATKFDKRNKITYNVQILPTTQYNYQELAKMYKEQMQLGFSKMLPQIALGQSQSSILATAYFENDILDLINVFIPPLMSSTMNSDILTRKQNVNTGKGGPTSGEGEGGGRPTNESKGKVTTEKTIQNQESKGNG
jgi:hypothetical protein